MADDEDDSPNPIPVPNAALGDRFSLEIYQDDGDDFAPFGGDEAWDAIYEVMEDPASITPTTTLRQLAEGSLEDWDGYNFDEMEPDDEYVDPILIALGILLILTTGGIDDEGRAKLIEVLERREALWGSETENFRIMLRDVRAL